MGRARNISFYALFSKIFLFSAPNWRILSVVERTRLQIGADFRLWHQNWCRFRERDFCCGIKIDAILITSSLIPSGKGRFLSSFQKIFRVLNPHWETVLSTYPARISPTIPYSNFCNWKTTRFLKKFSLNPIPQLSKPKNDIFSETFSKNVLTPLPHVFGQKTDTLFQKSFPIPVSQVFRANLNPFFGIVALLLIPGHLRAKTEHQSWKT